MPHVIVHFDPTKVDQELIDQLKSRLPQIVAEALTFSPSARQEVSLISVRQQAAHPTDVTPAAIEFEIQAGDARERSAQTVAARIVNGIIRTKLIPLVLFEFEKVRVRLRFSSHNGFATFNPKSD
jgi:hypothetical protein